MAFTKANESDQNGINNNAQTRIIPYEEYNKTPPLVFYKASNDNLLTSTKHNQFYIINNKLVLTFKYDHDEIDYPKLIAVDIPEEISTYFIELINESKFA